MEAKGPPSAKAAVIKKIKALTLNQTCADGSVTLT